jgi:dTDP-glucose 4,6-dehydratase
VSAIKAWGSNLSRKKVLVTGSDGFIGSHLVEALVRQGADVRAFVAYNSFGTWGWLEHVADDVKGNFDVFAGDVRDPFGVKNSMQDCDRVFHLAALIAIPYSYHSPASYVETNVKGTLNVVQAARELEVSQVVHTSTSEVYGTAQRVPIDESHPLQGQSPYAASKIGADQLAMSYHLSFGTPVAIARPFNTYGPRQSARAVLPTIITQILNGNPSVRLGALTPTRDFNYVADTVEGFLAVGASPKAVGEVINLGSNFEVSVGDAAKVIADVIGTEIAISTDEVRIRPEKSEVVRLRADNRKAAELLGWSPRFGGMEGFRAGIERTVEWFRDPRNLAGYRSSIYNT